VQTECGVTLNCVESSEGFVSDINGGRWDSVLPVVANLKLPRSLLEQLYEHVGANVQLRHLL
jgi:WD40 repeat-containing protein SMU1